MELKLDKLVKIEKKENSKMRGIAKVLIDGCFLVEDIRILEGDEGLFIAMPSKKRLNGEHKDIAHPIDPETREKIEKAIFEAYNNAPEPEETATAEDSEEVAE